MAKATTTVKKKTSTPSAKKPKATRAPAAATAASALPSLSLSNAELVDIGSRYAADRLITLTATVLAKVGSYPFDEYGLDGKWVSAVRQLSTKVESQSQGVSNTKSAAIPTGATLDAAVADAKVWRRRAATVISITPGLQTRAPRLASGSSVPQLIKSIEALVPLSNHASTTRWGGGSALKAAGEKSLTALRNAREAHRTALASLSPELRTLHASKGALYEELRRLARVARDVAPAEASLFAVSTHLRGHGRKKTAPAAGQPANGTATPAAKAATAAPAT